MNAVIWAIAIGFGMMGLAALVRPALIWAPFGVEPTTAASRNEVRAVYGGFGLALAALMIWVVETGPDVRSGVLLTVAISLFGMAAGRVISALVEPRALWGWPGVFLLIELGAGDLLLMASEAARYARRVLVLAFDTSAPAVSVAVHDGAAVLASATGEGAMAHGELLAPAIARALGDAGASMQDVTDVAVGVGPGPFTGLRVGVVTALTLGASLGVPTHGVCSLDVLAAEMTEGEPFLIATDARRKEVYWALYDRGPRGLHRVEGPAVDRPDSLAALHPGVPVIGRGAQLYADVLTALDGPLDPSAGVLAGGVAAGAFDEVPLEPLYLRRPDVAEPTAPKRA